MDIFSDIQMKLKVWDQRLHLWSLVEGAVEGVPAEEVAPQWEGEWEEVEDLQLWEEEACLDEHFNWMTIIFIDIYIVNLQSEDF